jgi:transcriptional regulator with XRE-family HTH domain
MPRSALTGSRIRDRRLAAGLRQVDLARAAGISASYLNLIEHNRRRIGGKLVADLARALGCEISQLTEGAEAMLLAALREAARSSGRAGEAAETERVEEFAGRFPGWAGLLAERHRRVQALTAEVAALSDRLAHDPHLSAALHELLTAVTAIRSASSILSGTEDLGTAWRARFLAILSVEGERLARGAEALARSLGDGGSGKPVAATAQEEVEAFLESHGWHLPALEAPDADESTVEALVNGSGIGSASGRSLAREALRRYLGDARRLPLVDFAPATDAPAGELADRFGVPLDAVLRRLATLPEREVGLVIADAAGAIVFRRPLQGFPLPRHEAACPLWPLFAALSRPAQPVGAVVEMPGLAPRRVRAVAVAMPTGPLSFSAEPVIRSTMLLTPAPGAVEARPVGPTCRICPREDCRARREPSILGA